MQLEHTFQNVRSQNARFQYVRKLRQNVRADATKPLHYLPSGGDPFPKNASSIPTRFRVRFMLIWVVVFRALKSVYEFVPVSNLQMLGLPR